MLRCRLCLGDEVEELISLYCRCETQDKLVVEMLSDFLRLSPPEENDQLPQHICDQCLIRLDTGYGFQQKCRNAERSFNGSTEAKADGDEGLCCRVCLRDDVDELISVFCVSGGEDKLVADMIKSACGVERPLESNGLPQNICGECFETLSTTFTFRNMILKSDLTMRKDLVKIEVPETDGRRQPDDGRLNSKKLKLPRPKYVPRNDEEADPFIYLDSLVGDAAERLMPLFFSTEEAQYYEQLIFFGILCCCGKLVEDEREAGQHQKLDHITKELSSGYRHKCEICRRRFQYASDLQEHLEKRDKKLFYRCKICNILTKDKRSLERHFEFTRFHPFLDESEAERLNFDAKVETKHESLGICCGCFEEFENGQSLLKHTQEAHYPDREDYPVFQCMICYNSFSDKQMLLKHQLNFLGTTTYECREPDCEFRTDKRAVMKRHVEAGLHLNVGMLPAPKPAPAITEFFCCFQFCYETFETREALEQHCLDRHAEQRLTNSNFTVNLTDRVCPLCIRHFPTANAYEGHLRSQYERKYICGTCGRKCATRDYLTKHEKSHVQEKMVFPCDQCSLTYSNKYSLLMHIKKIHDQILTNLCTTCGKAFATKSALKYHIVNKHFETRPYKCEVCSKDFGARVMLQRHMITHSTERPFKCSECENAYRHQSDLKRHEDSVHKNNRPFVCDICEASFIRDRDLRLHMTRHTHQKFYKCPVANCEYSANIAKRIEEHVNNKHNDATKMEPE